MAAPPRRKARTTGREGRNWKSFTRCADCDKATYRSRSEARKAIKAWHASERNQVEAYECTPDSGRWHVGHTTPSWIRARRAA